MLSNMSVMPAAALLHGRNAAFQEALWYPRTGAMDCNQPSTLLQPPADTDCLHLSEQEASFFHFASSLLPVVGILCLEDLLSFPMKASATCGVGVLEAMAMSMPLALCSRQLSQSQIDHQICYELLCEDTGAQNLRQCKVSDYIEHTCKHPI